MKTQTQTTATPGHTPGALRAAEAINTQLAAVNVRMAPARLAAIIDRETAAPELLEALQDVLAAAGPGWAPGFEHVEAQARAAIARATEAAP